MSLYDELKARGFIYQVSDEELVKDAIDNKKIVFYLGIDPTASSMHIGHFYPIMLVRKLQQQGHQPIIIVGGATGMIGDPSGRSEMRKVLAKKNISDNLEAIKKSLSKFLSFEGDNKCIIVNNYDWMKDYSYINFMRDIGSKFNVNSMLATDAYKRRLEEGGLTFFEMGYMLMQAYDFIHLKEKYNCVLEIGGSDQWANMVAGMDLYRKINPDSKDSLMVLTCPLLMNYKGEKMGKTAEGALWISEEKLSPYEFYQLLINFDDQDVKKMLLLFTQITVEEIEKLINSDIRIAKERMAYEITKLIHGEEKADLARKTSQEVFKSKNFANLDELKMDKKELLNINILDLLVKTNLVPSKSEGRRLVTQNGIRVNNELVDLTKNISEEDLNENSLIIQKGKKIHLKIVV